MSNDEKFQIATEGSIRQSMTETLTDRVSSFQLEESGLNFNYKLQRCDAFTNDDDTASTLYSDTASTLYSDTASTLIDYGGDDTSTLVGIDIRIKKPIVKRSPIAENDLSNIRVIVTGYNIKNDTGKEVIYCTLSIRHLVRKDYQDIINDRFRHLWKVEKNYNDFLKFDAILKEQGYLHKDFIPVKGVFNSHVPTKIDQRKNQIDHYFRILFSLLPIKDASPICQFLNTDIVEQQRNFGRTIKEGYLTRKEGKMFMNWKARYCVLKGTTFQLYETCAGGGEPIDTIPLYRSMIGTVNPSNSSSDTQHGIAVLQFRRERPGLPDFYRHYLCATSDEERDEWVNKLSGAMHYLDKKQQTKELIKQGDNSLLNKLSRKMSTAAVSDKTI